MNLTSALAIAAQLATTVSLMSELIGDSDHDQGHIETEVSAYTTALAHIAAAASRARLNAIDVTDAELEQARTDLSNAVESWHSVNA